jgi:hypothetical protein
MKWVDKMENWDIPEAELMDTNLIIPTLRENVYTKQCSKCGDTFYAVGKEPVALCENCLNEKTCNRCAQPISLEEYESNIDGYCEECWEEEYNEY